jgi:hypothetical protein
MSIPELLIPPEIGFGKMLLKDNSFLCEYYFYNNPDFLKEIARKSKTTTC